MRKFFSLVFTSFILFFCVNITEINAVTSFYVDPDFSGSVKDGSAEKPWIKLTSNPNSAEWVVINSALSSDDVTIYFSAKDDSSDSNQISPYGVNIARTNNSSNRLVLDGMSKFNTNDENPVWVSSYGNFKHQINYGYSISSLGNNSNNVTIRGFKAIGGYNGYGGQALIYNGGDNIIIEENELTHDALTSHGANTQFGYAHKKDGGGWGEHVNIVIRNNWIHHTRGEAIYIGGSENTGLPAHSNILVEGNLIHDVGVYGGEGDCIDIKDGMSGVVIKNNICYKTTSGNANGISTMSGGLIENNVLYDIAGQGISIGTYWGNGFSGTIVKNNLVFNGKKSGLYISADLNKPVSNTTIINNTFYGNLGSGLVVGDNSGAVTNLSSVSIKNNLLVKNGSVFGTWGKPSYSLVDNNFFDNTGSLSSLLLQTNISVDPLFINTLFPAGSDQKFFTNDDGLKPQYPSLVCQNESRQHIGYIPCDGNNNSPPLPVSPPPTTPTPLKGDLNLDKEVNSLDWSIMNTNWYTSNSTSDLNTDGLVNSLDYALLSNNWGKTW